MQGMVNSNYSGTSGVLLNPSSFSDSKLYFDLSLVTGDIFFQNNYIYVPKSDYYLGYFFRRNAQFPKQPNGKSVLDHFQGQYKSGFANVRLNGPSFMITSGRQSFGFYAGFRAAISAHDIPFHTAKLIFDGTKSTQIQDQDFVDNQSRYSMMMWEEIAAVYSLNIIRWKMHHVSVGGTVKYLMGNTGSFGAIQNLDYSIPGPDSLIINDFDAKIGYTAGNNFLKGNGFGFDFGITYEIKPKGSQPMNHRKLCQQSYDDYTMKFGASILDLGTIFFNKGTQKYEYNNLNTVWTNADSIKIRELGGFSAPLNRQFYGSANATDALAKDNFGIGLPLAISLQYDYHAKRYWYINANLIYGIKLGRTSLRRPTQLTVTPRFERRWFEANFPLSFYELKYPRLGLSLRFGNLTIGSDKIAGFFDYADFYGLDFYFSLHFNLARESCSKRGFNFPKMKRIRIFGCRHF